MKKSKKEQPRPRFVCPKCRMMWINCDVVCILCGIVGTPLNEGAEKLIVKYKEGG